MTPKNAQKYEKEVAIELPIPRYSSGKSSPISSHEIGEIPVIKKNILNSAKVAPRFKLTQGKCDCEYEHTQQRNPVVIATCRVILIVVHIRAEAGERETHEHAADDEERNSTDDVD